MLFKAELVGGSPWGFRLEDGIGGDGGQDGTVRIAKMNASSKAQSKGVQVGDIVHCVNGQSVTGMSSSQVMQIVRNAGDVLSLEIIRGHHSSIQGDVSSSGISSSDSFSYISHSSTVSANHDVNSSSNRSSPSSPFADKTNRQLSTFGMYNSGQKTVKSYRPVSFDVPTGVSTSREEENSDTTAPKSLFASEFTLDRGHDLRYNSDSQKTTTFNSDSTNLRLENSTPSTNTFDNNQWNLEKDRLYTSNSSGLMPTHSTSHSMDFAYSTPSDSLTSNTRNLSVSSLNGNLSDSQSRLPVVKNPTITLLQKKRADGLLSKSLTSFGNESSELNNAFTSKPTSESSSSNVRQSGQSADHANAMDRLKKWKEARLLHGGNQTEERFGQSGNTGVSVTDDNSDKQGKHSITTNDTQNSSEQIFSRENGNQSPELSLHYRAQKNIQPSSKYAGSGVADSHADEASLERKLVKFEGVGPVDERTGILMSTRSSLDERNQKDWYKEMYKSLHKSDRDLESLYVFPGDDGDKIPSWSDRNRRKSTHEVTYTIRKATPDDKDLQRYASTPSLAEANPEVKTPSSSPSKTAGIKNNRRIISSVAEPAKYRRASTPNSPTKKLSESWTPAQYKYENQPYKVQPRRIEDYEPGQSSVLQTDGHRSHSSVGNLYKDEVYIKPNRRSENREDSDLHSSERPVWKSTSMHDQRQKPADETKKFNNNNGDYPPAKISTFKTPAPVDRTSDNFGKYTNGFLPYQSNEKNGSEISHSRESSGYNSTSAVSSLGIRDLPPTTVHGSQYDFKMQNSHQEDNRVTGVQPTIRSDQTHPISLAKAVYSFRAQSPSDLSFHEGDAIYIFDKIDDNWYKGECNGKVGKFPINFVERQNSTEGENLSEIQSFGKGHALYDFKAQTLLELSFKKNDELSLIGRVNKDWFEACIGKQKGFVPANYVDIIKEPSSLSSPKKLLSPQETTRPSLRVSTSSLTLSPAVQQNNDRQRRISRYQDDSFNGSRPAPDRSVSHQRVSSMGSDVQYRKSGETPSQKNTSFENQPLPNSASQSSFRSMDHLNNDRSKPASAFANGSGKTSNPGHNVAVQPMQRSYDIRTPAPDVAGTNALGTKLVSAKTATVWPTHKAGGEMVQTPNSFGKSRYRASFAYNPRRADELALHKGDIVYVMEQYDDGWFVGMSERTKKLGTFPGNYVEAL